MARVTRSGKESTASDAEGDPAENTSNRPARQTRPTMKAIPDPPPPPKPALRSKPIAKKRPRATTESNLLVPKASRASKATAKASKIPASRSLPARPLKSILKKSAKDTTPDPEPQPDIINVSSSPAIRTPKAKRFKNDTFDPTVPGDSRQVVVIQMEPFIEGRPLLLATIPYQMDINNTNSNHLGLLHLKLENRAIKPWADRRKLSQDNQPVREDWVVFLGSTTAKATQSVAVSDHMDWESILTELRLRKHAGKEIGTINIKAYYSSVIEYVSPSPTN